ncbi:alpha/beta hydrolase [Rhodococcoides trifolii]|uniref:Alpha/beta hydrolase n=1 Tax=Rhodococcoides trifolii TaxID=908250 RepID=A0A917CQR2_9NOCA|nr:alpha/beta hydrolase [Rhodococcus trifolii]GGF95081.1 alpha/beta hydrolase [Rhodococcus trifolii]
MPDLLFVHGAGGFVDDGPLADALARALGRTAVMPEFSSADMSFEAWATPLRAVLTETGSDTVVVAHSFGASILVRVLAEPDSGAIASATVLAMPDWGASGWDVPEYAVTAEPADVALALHHCRDDDVVPVDHLSLNSVVLPSATLHEHPSGGHQFEGCVEAIAALIRPGT